MIFQNPEYQVVILICDNNLQTWSIGPLFEVRRCRCGRSRLSLGGSGHPGGKEGDRRDAREGRPCGPSSLSLSGPGVLERGRAGGSSVTWARTGKLWRDKPYPGMASLRCLTVLHLATTCTGPGQAETDGCTHSALHTLTFFLEFTLSCAFFPKRRQ